MINRIGDYMSEGSDWTILSINNNNNNNNNNNQLYLTRVTRDSTSTE